MFCNTVTTFAPGIWSRSAPGKWPGARCDSPNRAKMTASEWRSRISAILAAAGADFAQVFARHAVESVDGLGVIARGDQQLVEWGPIVSPVEVEADALAELALVDFAAPPFVENVLVAGEDGFDSQHDRAVPGQGALLDQRGSIALGGGQ